MNVLVTGAGGQLGQDLVDAFDDHQVSGLGHDDLDVADEPAVWAAVGDLRPDVVVHAAAWTDVDGCEGDPDRAHRVNALGSWWVARACDEVGAAMALVSTDYVFAGEGRRGRHEPYREFDVLDPLNEYGRSKAAAEALVRQTLDRHYIVRTAWVNGARGSNFVRTMLRVGRERGEATVVDDQVGSPTFTRDLAAAIRELAVSGRYGTYHRTNSGECSWFDLAAATYELAGVDVELHRMSSDDLDRPAPRPAYSVLSNRHAVLSGLMTMPHWRDGLRRMLTELGETDDG
ncbi:MAG: dTDP-4-dehydrorhamnose reductase [Nitriliruptorales bacterium]|nr:dTDP-4-dehydrorhamnose reductase [Nitriliruptorales bacterium]